MRASLNAPRPSFARLWFALGLWVGQCLLGDPLLAADTALRPNIVFVMADDIGWGDFQCYNPNGKVPTPNLDRLAREGMRFTDAHTPAALCAQRATP